MAIKYIQTPFRVLDTVSPRLSARLALELFTKPRHWPPPVWEQEIAGSAEPVWLANGHSGLSWGHGRPVLLVHGWEGRVTQLGRFVAPLLARGFRVIGFNAPGHGEHHGKALDVVAYAQFLRTVVAEYGPLRGVIAHSMGAAAIAFAARLRLRVDRAVLIATPGSVGDVVQRFEDLLGLRRPTRRIFRERLETEVFKRRLDELDLREQVPEFLPQTLLLAADDDQDVPVTDTQLLAAQWPRARMKIALHAGGHRKLLRDERVIDAAVGFLGEESWLPRAADAPAARPDETIAPIGRTG